VLINSVFRMPWREYCFLGLRVAIAGAAASLTSKHHGKGAEIGGVVAGASG
jgi:hypothetical protein